MYFYRKWAFWLIAFIIILGAAFSYKKIFNSLEVKVSPVKKQDLIVTVTATSTGTIKSDREMKITAQRIGKVSKLFVEEGDAVRPGSMIAELDPDEANLNLQISQASLEKTKAVLRETEARLRRLNELKTKGYISQFDIDAITREYDVAAASVKEAGNSLSLARLNYDYSFIRSSIHGIVTSRPVKLGETVAKGALIVNLVSLTDLYIEAFIDEADVARVKVGQEVNITMDAYFGKVFKGEVYMISPVVLGGKQETRTFEVRTRFKEQGIVVKPGMSADVEIIVDSVRSTLVVPSQAVVERNGKKVVYLKADSRAKLTPVEAGRFNWNFIEIISGVREGDIVITNPDVTGLEDNRRVKEEKKSK